MNDGPADQVWGDLGDEIRTSRARKVVLSCENFLMPLRDDRADKIAELGARLSGFSAVLPVAFVRRSDIAIDRLYRETMTVGTRGR